MAPRDHDDEDNEAVRPELVDDRWGTAADDDDAWAADDRRWRETWHEDPAAPKTTAGRLDQMGRDLRRLTRESLGATVLVAVLFALLEAWNGQGYPHTTGFFIGGALATLNLWLLAGGYFAVVDGRAVLPRVALAAVGSLSVLLLVAVWIVFTHHTWALGFGIGLAVPALGGIVHALRAEDR
jgi:hypothetical protein